MIVDVHVWGPYFYLLGVVHHSWLYAPPTLPPFTYLSNLKMCVSWRASRVMGDGPIDASKQIFASIKKFFFNRVKFEFSNSPDYLQEMEIKKIFWLYFYMLFWLSIIENHNKLELFSILHSVGKTIVLNFTQFIFNTFRCRCFP